MARVAMLAMHRDGRSPWRVCRSGRATGRSRSSSDPTPIAAAVPADHPDNSSMARGPPSWRCAPSCAYKPREGGGTSSSPATTIRRRTLVGAQMLLRRHDRKGWHHDARLLHRRLAKLAEATTSRRIDAATDVEKNLGLCVADNPRVLITPGRSPTWVRILDPTGACPKTWTERQQHARLIDA